METHRCIRGVSVCASAYIVVCASVCMCDKPYWFPLGFKIVCVCLCVRVCVYVVCVTDIDS